MDCGHTGAPVGRSEGARRRRARLPRLIMLGMLSGALMGASASAALLIDVGSHALLPNTPGQEIAITISNDGDPVPLGGFELLVRVADGGPAWGGSILGPTIQEVDLLEGTPFEKNNLLGQFPSGDNVPQRQFWGVVGTPTLATGSSLLLATVTFDTTGFDTGTWDLFLGGLQGANTRLLTPEATAYDVTIVNGSLAVVPEPSAAATVVGCLLFGVLLVNRGRRRLRQ